MKKTLLAGLVFLVIGLLGLFVLDLPLTNHQSVTLLSPEGTHLSAAYYPGSVPAGVLVLEGFGADQHMLRSLVRDLTASGLHVFTFDYSGHGSSPGALGYDNASTDRLAGQVQSAMKEFMQLSGLQADQIVWMGHSLGARVALQSSVLGPTAPSRLVLLGAQVNLGTNAQSEFFTGTTDRDLPWVQSLGPDNPSIPILLLTGSWDDILTVEGARLFMHKLCDDKTISCSGKSERQWVVFDALVHNYEVFSPRAITSARNWAFPDLPHPASLAALRLVLWLVILTGVIAALIALRNLFAAAPAAAGQTSGITIEHPARLVWARLWLWLAALPVSILVMVVYTLIPLPSPTFNLIYGGFLGGYGLVIFLLYRLGRMPGVTGKVHVSPSRPPLHNGWIWAAVFNLALFAVMTMLYRSGIGLAPPAGVRFVWVLIFTPLAALGLWLGLIEGEALSSAAPLKPVYRIFSTLFSLLPFFLYLLLLLGLGSTSGVLGTVTGLIILGMSLFQGEITRKLTGNAVAAAVIQSVFIFWFILPSGALFVPFF